MRSNHQTLKVNKKDRFSFHKASAGQWNQILSGVVCVLGFSFIFTGMLFFTLNEISGNDGNTTALEDSDYYQYRTAPKTNLCNLISCTITCTGFDLSNDLSITLEEIYQESIKENNCETKSTELNLKNTIFKNKTLSNTWIQNISFRFGVLSIEGGLERIAPGAFIDEAFSALKKLELADFSFSHLQSGAFDGLNNIQHLIIKDGTISKIDNNVFEPIKYADNLDIQSSSINLTLFTGSEYLSSMQLVSISYAKGMEIVTKETFAGLKSVQSLYLHYNGIDVIKEYAFAGMSQLKLLHINNNNLKTLSQKIFNSIWIKPKMFISSNHWNCTCELKWIQEYIRQNIVSDIPICFYPSEHQFKKIIDVEIICPEEETTTLEPLTTTSSTDPGSEITDSTTLKPPTTQTESTSSGPGSEVTTNPTTSKPPTTQTESTSSGPGSEVTTNPTTSKPSTTQTESTSSGPSSEVTTNPTTSNPPTTQTESTSSGPGSEVTTNPTTSKPPTTQTESTSFGPSSEVTTNPTTSNPPTTQTESTSTHIDIETTTDTTTEIITETTTEITTVSSNPTTTTISPSQTTSTTHTSRDEVRINCQAPKSYSDTENKYNRKLLSTGTNYVVTKQNLNFSLNDNENGEVTVEILSPLTSTDILVWFIGNLDYFGILESSDAIGCQMIVNSKLTVENLVSGESYTFCLMNMGDSKVSPLDCRAVAIRMPWNRQIWLANDDKMAIIGVVSASLIVCLLVGAIVIYVLIRRNPSLLRGSKRIVMVKHRAAEVIVMPPNFKDVCESKVKEEKRPQKRCLSNKRKNFRRSVSETSIISTRSAAASYVSAVEPTAVQLLHWRLERLRGSSGGKDPGSGGPLLMPPTISSLPPLPPKRPTTTELILEDESLSGTSEV